jgi:hypothetical protein
MRAVGVKSYSAAVWKFRLTSSRFLPRLAVSHGGGEADRVAQPPPWRFQDFRSDQNITAVCMTVTAVQGTRQSCGSRYRPPRRSDQWASITRLSSGQRAIRFAASGSNYPFHPDLTDIFYTRWTQLDGFQRTRGILRNRTGLRHAETEIGK